MNAAVRSLRGREHPKVRLEAHGARVATMFEGGKKFLEQELTLAVEPVLKITGAATTGPALS
jgi:hypothetical protein